TISWQRRTRERAESKTRSGKWCCSRRLPPRRRARLRSPEAERKGMTGGRGHHNGLLSRRRFLQALGLAGLGSGICAPALFASGRPVLSTTAFEEISASISGISWTHVSGRSPMAHLPETVGAGCAFLDYDNDGWMDIYLVNSGPCDFYDPRSPLRNALYRNNHDGTCTDVTQKARVPGNAYGMGVAVGDYDGDGWP